MQFSSRWSGLAFDVFALLSYPAHAVSRGVTLRAPEQKHNKHNSNRTDHDDDIYSLRNW